MSKESCVETIKQILKSGGVYKAVSPSYYWDKDIQALADTIYELSIEGEVIKESE